MFKKITIPIVRAELCFWEGKGERPKTKGERPKVGVEGGKLKVESVELKVESSKFKVERGKLGEEGAKRKVERPKTKDERPKTKGEKLKTKDESAEWKVESLKWIPNWSRVPSMSVRNWKFKPQVWAFAIFMVLCTCGMGLSAQPIAKQEFKPLQVGDQMPEWFWSQAQQLYGNGVPSVDNLSRYKGKLLVLDFWASWCSTCLKKWPLLDSLARVYPDELAVLLVNEKRNGDDLNRIRQRMDGFLEGKALSLPTIYGDSVLGRILPHQFLPHYVWISEQGVVLAITGTEFMTADLVVGMIERRLKKKNKISN